LSRRGNGIDISALYREFTDALMPRPGGADRLAFDVLNGRMIEVIIVRGTISTPSLPAALLGQRLKLFYAKSAWLNSSQNASRINARPSDPAA
jgi:hypothetical protein